ARELVLLRPRERLRLHESTGSPADVGSSHVLALVEVEGAAQSRLHPWNHAQVTSSPHGVSVVTLPRSGHCIARGRAVGSECSVESVLMFARALPLATQPCEH